MPDLLNMNTLSNTQPSDQTHSSNEPVSGSEQAVTNAARQIVEPSAGKGLASMLTKQAPGNKETTTKPNGGKFARLLSSQKNENQPPNKRIRIETPTIQNTMQTEVHDSVFTFQKQWVKQITDELDLIDAPQQTATPEYLAQTKSDSMEALANYKTNLIQRINAAPHTDSALVNLLREKLLVALNSSPSTLLIDQEALENLSEKVFLNKHFESIGKILNQVSPQLTDVLLQESATPGLRALIEGDIFPDEDGYENDQVKMAQALLIDVVLGEDSMQQAYPSGSNKILFALRNQMSNLSFQDEERLLIDFATSQGADPDILSPFSHTEGLLSQSLPWEAIFWLKDDPDRYYHLLETLFYNGAEPHSEEPQELSVAPVNIFSALCAAPEIDDLLIARLIDHEEVDINANVSLDDNQNSHLNTPLGWAIQDESENGPKKVDLLLTNGANRATLIHIIDTETRWNDDNYWDQEAIENIQTLPIDDYVQQLEDSPRKTALLEILNRHPLPNP